MSDASNGTLLILRDNLLVGLDRVSASLEDGTFHKIGKKGEAPPSQSGTLTLGMLVSVNNTLVARGYETVFVEG